MRSRRRTWDLAQPCGAGGELAAELADNILCACQQEPRPPVVAETGPHGVDLVLGRRRERLDCRKLLRRGGDLLLTCAVMCDNLTTQRQRWDQDMELGRGVYLHPSLEVLGCPRDLRLLAHDLADPHEVNELLLRQAERRPIALGAIGTALALGVPAPG